MFIPDVENVFYRIDVEGGNNLNAGLRHAWSEQRNRLAVHGSAEDSSLQEYQLTLGNDGFPFYQRNFDIQMVE